MGFLDSLKNFAAAMRNDSFGAKSSFKSWLAEAHLTYEQRKRMASRIGLAHRLVWVVPQDALAKGWRCDSDSGQDISRDEDNYFCIEQKLLYAYGGARQNGGGWLWLVTGDGDEESELLPGSKVLAIHDLTMSEVTAVSMQADPRSLQWGKPDFWSIQVSRDNLSFYKGKVHHSRLVYIPGAPVTRDTHKEKVGYDLSYLQLYRRALEDLEEGWSSSGQMLQRLAMFWVRLREGAPMAAAEGNEYQDVDTGLGTKMSLLKDSMGKSGIMVLLGDDEIGWTAPPVSGVSELTTTQAERISAVEGISLSKILGQAPGGLSTDDASGKRNYYDLIERERRTKLTAALLKVYEALYGVDHSRRIEWPPLETASELERAQTSLALAQRDQILITMGQVSLEESRARYADGEESANFSFSESDMDLEQLDENMQMPMDLVDGAA